MYRNTCSACDMCLHLSIKGTIASKYAIAGAKILEKTCDVTKTTNKRLLFEKYFDSQQNEDTSNVWPDLAGQESGQVP